MCCGIIYKIPLALSCSVLSALLITKKINYVSIIVLLTFAGRTQIVKLFAKNLQTVQILIFNAIILEKFQVF